MSPLERERTLRLFQQLHQDNEEEWYRANGSMYCRYCGLQYRDHYIEQFYHVDHRLCNGITVHL